MFDFMRKKDKPGHEAQAADQITLKEADIWKELMGGGGSITGVTVNRESAMRVSAVYSCVRLLSESVASLPLNVHGEGDGGLEIAAKHPVHSLLHEQPNNMMSSFTWVEMIMAHALYEGNHYSVIVRSQRGQPLELRPLLPDQVQCYKKDGRLYYKARSAGGVVETLLDDEVLHIPGHGFDGITGYSPIRQYARESIGLSLATQEHGSRLFSNGTNLGGTLETEQKIDVARQKELLKFFNEQYRGVTNAQKTAMLTDGLKFNKIGMTSEDAQFLETRKFQVTEIARIFGVPPHMIADLEKATFSNIEHQNINFVTFSLRPWLKRIESELNRKLFAGTKYYARFNVDGLLRGDYSSRMEGHSKALSVGLMTPNEARKLENLPPIEGGDTLRVPVNTEPVTAKGKKK